MIKNYFKTAFRNLLNNKFYSSINIIGLAAGLATCLLIMLYVLDELSYDRYNKNAERIYRVDNEVKIGGNYLDLANCPALLGATMVKEFPQVQQYTRLQWHSSLFLKKGNENIEEGRVCYADSTLFEVFTLPMIAGNPKTALVEPHSLVISEKVARKFFNSVEVVGKTMLVNDTVNYKVTGVIKNVPKQSHFNFDVFVPMIENPQSNDDNWLGQNWNTYILLKEGVDANKLKTQLNEMVETHTSPVLKSVLHQTMDEFKKSGSFVRASLFPLTAIHQHSNKIGELDGNGNATVIYIFFGIALLILVIACINFMNLSTARSSNRAKEVGVRKVLGSLKKNLVQQFLVESLLISLISLGLALLAAWLLLPYFNNLTGKEIHAGTLFQPVMLLSLIGLIIIVGLLAGSYPAFFLSAFQPIVVLKGKLSGGFKRSWLRNTLVVFQFAVSIMLIFGTIVIYNQLDYIQHKNIGYNRSQILTIKHTDVLRGQAPTFKKELLQISGVQDATMSGFLPVNYYRNNDAFFTSAALNQESAISMQQWFVDENYIPALGIQVMQGRNFSDQFPTDSSAMIINEAAAKFLDWKDLENRKLYSVKDIKTKEIIEYHIIGMVKNFNFKSLRDVVTPLSLVLGNNPANISVRIDPGNAANVISQLKNKWRSMAPGQPFDYSFMDDDFNKQYTTEQRTGAIFITFAVLAVLIASLGLFGLITYACTQRAKEIGIRKVLGASVTNIAGMLSKDFLKLVFISSAIAFPLAWWGMTTWLKDFAYRVSISAWVFIVAGSLAILIAVLTISFQAVKSAITNPAKSLRTE